MPTQLQPNIFPQVNVEEDVAIGSYVELFKAVDNDVDADGFVTYFIDNIVSGIILFSLIPGHTPLVKYFLIITVFNKSLVKARLWNNT